MEILSIIQYVFCLLAQCDSNDGVKERTTSTSPLDVALRVINISNDVAQDNELVRYERDTGMHIVQEAIGQSGERLHDGNRGDGLVCRFNLNCSSGCCLLDAIENSTRRHCSPLAGRGELCGLGQLKGGAYADFCPCSAGNGACEQVANDGHQRLCAQ